MREVKNEKSLEELKQELEAAQKMYETLLQSLKEKEVEENERKRAKLALEKENRTKIIEEKEKELISLVNEYIRDYGEYKGYCYVNKTHFGRIYLTGFSSDAFI